MVRGILAAVCLSAGLASVGQAADNSGVAGALSGAFDAVHNGIELLLPKNLKDTDSRIRLGAGFGTLPDYVGSDDYRLKVLPIIDVRWKKRWRINFNRLSYSVISKSGFELAPFVKFKAGRGEDRHPVLEGIGDVDPTAQVGMFARYKTDRMLVNVEYRHGLSGRRGSTALATFGHGIFKHGNWGVAAAIRVKWMNQKAMQTEFGITEAQSRASSAGLDIYTPNAGLSDMSINLLGRWKLTEKYRLLALVGYGRMYGPAADSPIVAGGAGSRNQFRAGIGFTIDML